MGALFSSTTELIDIEQTSWIKGHNLALDENKRQEQLPLLDQFKNGLKLCYIKNILYGIEYEHWFITDGDTQNDGKILVLEFGGGDITGNTVEVHYKTVRDYIIDEDFNMNEEIKARMKKVLGATNYSLALRNCEHVARYTYTY